MPIPMTNSTASRASLTGISGVYSDHRNTQGSGLIFNKGAELIKSPRVKIRSLLPTVSGFPPNAREVFQNNDRIGILGGKLYDTLADHMIGVALETGFSARGVSERPLGALCPFALKARSHSPVVVLALFDLTTAAKDRVSIRGNSGGEIIHTEVYADDRFDLFNRNLLNIGFETDVKIKVSLSLAESGRGGSPSEILGLLLTADEGYLLAFANSADRDYIFLRYNAEIASALASLQEYTSLEIESCFPLTILFAPHCDVGTGDLSFGRDGDLRRKAKPPAHIVVDCLMQDHVIGTIAHFVGFVADVIQRVAICLHRLIKQCGLFCRGIQFQASSSLNLHSNLFVAYLLEFVKSDYLERGKAQFLSPLKQGVPLD